MDRKSHNDALIPSNCVYVFGGNLAGKLISGRAKIARNNFRVEYGTAEGPSAKGYAIPVRDRKLALLPLEDVRAAVERFLAYAKAKPKETFFIARVGCDEGEFGDEVMAEMFASAPSNCSVPYQWLDAEDVKLAA